MTQKEYYDFREDENTRHVSLVCLLKSAAKRWKIILLAGIILGCLFGGYKIFSIHSKKDAMIEEYDTYINKLDAYKESLREYKQTVKDLQTQINAKLTYFESSIKMNMDTQNVPMATADIGVTSTRSLKADDIAGIKNAIYNEVVFGDSANAVAEKYDDITATGLRELITCKMAASGPTLRITVRALDEETAAKYRDDLLVELGKKVLTMEKALGSFQIEAFNKGVMTGYDSELSTFQEKQHASVTTLESAAYTAQNQSNQLSKPVAVPQYSKKNMLISGIKIGAVGFAGGIILAIAAVIALLIQKGVIFTSDEIDGEFGIRTLAEFSDMKPEEAEKELDYVLARIENAMKEGASVIAVIGQASADQKDRLTKALNDRAGSSVNFIHIPDILENAESVRELKKADGVVLMEEIGKSDYLGVRKEIAVIADSGIEIVGSVYC